jgi:hypothetical protein
MKMNDYNSRLRWSAPGTRHSLILSMDMEFLEAITSTNTLGRYALFLAELEQAFMVRSA